MHGGDVVKGPENGTSNHRLTGSGPDRLPSALPYDSLNSRLKKCVALVTIWDGLQTHLAPRVRMLHTCRMVTVLASASQVHTSILS